MYRRLTYQVAKSNTKNRQNQNNMNEKQKTSLPKIKNGATPRTNKTPNTNAKQAAKYQTTTTTIITTATARNEVSPSHKATEKKVHRPTKATTKQR